LSASADAAQQFNRIFYCDGQPFLSYIPANSTLQWFNERGMYCNYKNATHSGDCVARLVTPAVTHAARTFFGCSDLPGLELENWDTRDCAVIGSHLEARTAWADMMNPFHTGLDQGFTILSLAVADDSGWYHVNYSTAYGSRQGTTFGYKQGCGFARDSKCITTVNGNPVGGGTPQHYFTATQNTQKQQCRLDRKGYGVVAVYDYAGSAVIGPQYQYFPGLPARGGGNEQADYCPLLWPDYGITGLNEGLCSNTLSWSSMPIYDQRRGMRYGANSVCVSTTLYNAAYSSNGGGVGCY
jgi:surface protein